MTSFDDNENTMDVGELLGIDSPIVMTGDVLTPPPQAEIKKIETENEKFSQASDEDFEEVRLNLKALMDTTSKAIEGIMKVAEEGDSPRAYEVVSDLVKTALEANNKLMDLHKNMKALKGFKDSEDSQKITNNNVFVGSTAELSRFIREFTKKINPEPKRQLEKRPPEASNKE